MALIVDPVVLEGRFVRLEPLSQAHASGLARVAEADLFRYFASLVPAAMSEAAMAEFVDRTLAMRNLLPFATIHRQSGHPIGMTSYLDIRPEHDGLEIGFTWIAKEHQGTSVNPECKLLLLRHAFETLGCERVQLKTDGRNLQSQAAIRKLGAIYEGTLRKHMRMPDGFMRDTVMFSIVRDEWPAVRERLSARLAS